MSNGRVEKKFIDGVSMLAALATRWVDVVSGPVTICVPSTKHVAPDVTPLGTNLNGA